jgi:uncharacterized protein (UPF0332 family)
MPIQPRQLLELAKSLICDDEVKNRAAASRAYYAAYHCCKPLADSLPDPPMPWRGSHDRLILAMQNCPPRGTKSNHKDIRFIGGKMALVRPLRVTADYQCADPFSRATAEQVIVECEGVITGIEALSP